MTDFCLVAASHSDATLDANLRRSPCASSVALHVIKDMPSAAIAYNRGLALADAPYVVFVHHDVFLPKGWDLLLMRRIAELTAKDPNWGVFGTYGVGHDHKGVGPVWSSSLGMIVGDVALEPMPVQSFDELLIVLRKDSGLTFDETLPGWHMYGTDIVQTALSRGLGAWAGGLPCIHNDRFHGVLGPDFTECYRFMQKKWAARLPVRTPIMKISRSGLHLWRNSLRDRKSFAYRSDMAVGTDHSPEFLAERCGWSDLTPSDAV